MDDADRSLLDALQEAIPLVRSPWAAVGSTLGLAEGEVLSRLERLVDERRLSFLGPIYDARALGYRTTLAALDVDAGHLDEVAAAVGSYPGVSHCYEREGRPSLWFTLAVPPGRTLASVVRAVARRPGVRGALILPELRRYKLRVRFRLGTAPAETSEVRGSPRPSRPVPLDEDDRRAVRLLGDGLPLTSDPFLTLAGSEEAGRWLLGRLEAHLRSGVARRVAALVRHGRVGYRANVMAVWDATRARADEAGPILAEDGSVSHCYLRRRAPGWSHSLYAMVHGRSEDEVEAAARRLASTANLPPPLLLRSLREFKKERLRFFTDDYDRWRPEGVGPAATVHRKEPTS